MQPLVCATCCTYKRPRELGNAIACFLKQDYPRDSRNMMILDDAGQYPGMHGREIAPGVLMHSVDARFLTLGEKRNVSVRLSPPGTEVIFVWDDDDAYLPWHMSSGVRALQTTCETEGEWLGLSKPSRVLCQRSANGKLTEKTTNGLYHGGWSFTRKAFDLVGGYPHMQSGQDQGLSTRMRESQVPFVDPLAPDARVSYIYRWFAVPRAYHLSAMDKQRGYDQLAKRPAQRVDELIICQEQDWVRLVDQHNKRK